MLFGSTSFFHAIGIVITGLYIPITVIGSLGLVYTTELIVRKLPKHSSFFIFISNFFAIACILGMGFMTAVITSLGDSPPTEADNRLASFAFLAVCVSLLALVVIRIYFHFRNKQQVV